MERKIAGAALFAFAAAAVLTGCSKPVLDYQNVQVENGKIYRAVTDATEGDTNKPFSGTVTNYPINEVLAGNQKSMERFLYVVGVGSAQSNSTDAMAIQNLGGGALARGLLATTTAMCDVSVSDGYLDGHANCKVPNSDVQSTQMGFDAGTLDGWMTYFDANGRKWAEAKFDEGAIKGKEKVYSPETGQLVLVVPWGSNGWDGDVKGYDAHTGELIHEVTYEDGKRQGVATSYSPDGQKIQTETFVDNVANGSIDTYDPKTGMHTSHGTMVKGLLDGDAQTWDAQGQLLANYVYKRGENVTPRPQVAAVDCYADAAKRTLVENMVCSNRAILDEDTQMMKAYKAAAASLVDSKRLEDDQRGWLASTRNKCTTVECLDKEYKDRITQLSSVGQPDLFGIDCSLIDRSSADDVRLICSDSNLVKDDQQMIASYKVAYVAAPPAEKSVIDDGIRNWVSSVRYRCRDAACMDRVFKDLTGKLNAIARNPSAPISAEALSSPPSETTSTEVETSPAPVQVGSTAPSSAPVAAIQPAPDPAPAVSAKANTPAAPESPSNIALQTAGAVTAPIRASFDCAKAGTTVEKMICSNQMLADEDVQLMRVYKAVLFASPNARELKLKQRAWVVERNACTSPQCVSAAYQKRIAELGTAH